MSKQLPREPTREQRKAAGRALDKFWGRVISNEPDLPLFERIYRAMHDAAPPSHDEEGVPYVDVPKEDVPDKCKYLATTETRDAFWFIKKPMPNDFGGWHGSSFKKAPDKYAITDQPWFLTLRRIRRV